MSYLYFQQLVWYYRNTYVKHLNLRAENLQMRLFEGFSNTVHHFRCMLLKEIGDPNYFSIE